jgi:hypothetical protein
MSKKPIKDMAASVRARLLALSRQQNEQFQIVLMRYTIERLLYRIGRSPHQNQFILKGAILFGVWSDDPHRPTHDLDLLGRGENTVAHLEQVFREICCLEVEDDGLEFSKDTVQAEAMREELEYAGVRIHIMASLDTARVPVQVDIGFGDAVTPRPAKRDLPALLDLPAPRLRVYPREAVVAEKYHAMVVLGMANSRMKDFYDLWVLSKRFEFDGDQLCSAISATFKRRRTGIPNEEPHALSERFFEDETKQLQWAGFVRRGRLMGSPPTLKQVIHDLRGFLSPPIVAIANNTAFTLHWDPPGPWTHKELAETEDASPGGG